MDNNINGDLLFRIIIMVGLQADTTQQEPQEETAKKRLHYL